MRRHGSAAVRQCGGGQHDGQCGNTAGQHGHTAASSAAARRGDAARTPDTAAQPLQEHEPHQAHPVRLNNPNRCANNAACIRLGCPSFARMCDTWDFTVAQVR